MKKLTTIVLVYFIAITFSFLSGCTSVNLSNNPEKLTEKAIQEFINEHQLQEPLAVDFISDYGAVVIYDGYIYEIWSGQNGLTSRQITSSNSNGVMILVSSEGTPYTAVSIMDREIQNQGESMTVYFDSLEIYDSEGQVIYRN